MGSPSRPAPAARPPKPVARIPGRAVVLPHARARASTPPAARVLGAPMAPLTATAPSLDQIPKAPALPTLNFGAAKPGALKPNATIPGLHAAKPFATNP